MSCGSIGSMGRRCAVLADEKPAVCCWGGFDSRVVDGCDSVMRAAMAQGVLTSRRQSPFYPFALCFARPCNTASLLFGRFRLAISLLSIHKTGIDIRPHRLQKPPATRPLTSLQDAVSTRRYPSGGPVCPMSRRLSPCLNIFRICNRYRRPNSGKTNSCKSVATLLRTGTGHKIS